MSSVSSPKAKRSLENGNCEEKASKEDQVDKEHQGSKAKRTKLTCKSGLHLHGQRLQWKLWVVKNYIFSERSLVPVAEVLEHAEKETQRLGIGSCLNSHGLTIIVNDLWDKKVKRVKRGSRGSRKAFLLNVARKQIQVRTSDNLKLEFEDMAKDNSLMLPNRWFKIVDNENKISLVHPESWEFENQRIYTEISIELNGEKQLVCFIKSHGSQVNLGDLKFQKLLEDLPLEIQVETLLEFVERSTLCLGCSFPGDSGILCLPLLPHKVGMLKSLNDPEISQQNQAFSSACEVIALSSNQCPICQSLKKSYARRKERKEKRTSINKYCNKRYLTKEEIHLQLQEEKKMRQKQLQEQKKSHDAESTDDDDEDDEGESLDDDDDDEEEEEEEEDDDDEESLDDDEEKGDKEEEEDNSGGVEWRIRNDSKGLTLYRV